MNTHAIHASQLLEKSYLPSHFNLTSQSDPDFAEVLENSTMTVAEVGSFLIVRMLKTGLDNEATKPVDDDMKKFHLGRVVEYDVSQRLLAFEGKTFGDLTLEIANMRGGIDQKTVYRDAKFIAFDEETFDYDINHNYEEKPLVLVFKFESKDVIGNLTNGSLMAYGQ